MRMSFIARKAVPRLDWAIRGAAIFVAAVGAVEMAAWLFHMTPDMGLPAGIASMRLNSGGGFAAAAGALWLIHRFPPESPPFRLGHGLAVLAAMLGSARLAQDLSAFLGINQLVLGDDRVAIGTLKPPRILPLTEFAFLFAGAALFVLKSRDPRVAVCSQWLVLPSFALAVLGIIGHAYGVAGLAAVDGAGSGAGAVRAGVGYARGRFNPRLHRASPPATPPAASLPGGCSPPCRPRSSCSAGLQVRGEAAGLFGSQFGAVAAVLIGVAVCFAVVVSTATGLRNIDLVRKEAMARIRDLNMRHERQIEERTAAAGAIAAGIE